MTFNLNFFLPALVLLWIPLPFSARKERSYTYRGQVTNASVSGLWRAWQNWLDLFRSAAGVYLLRELSIVVDLAGPSASMASWLKDGILLGGLLMQTLRFGPRSQGFHAPIFYLTGITAVLQPPMIAGFAIVVGWVFTCGIRDPRALIPLMGTALLIAGYFLGGMNRNLYLNFGLIGLPLFLSLMVQKRLIFVSRERRLSSVPKEPLPRTMARKEPLPRPALRKEARRETKVALKSRPSTAEQ